MSQNESEAIRCPDRGCQTATDSRSRTGSTTIGSGDGWRRETGPGARGTVDSGANIDGDPGNNSENDVSSIEQTFTLAPNQVPATLSFDYNFLTAESDGSVIPNPYDDIFQVTLANGGQPILAGSVPGGGISPYPDLPVDGVEIDVTGGSNTHNCSFEWGQSGFKKGLKAADLVTNAYIDPSIGMKS